ncbi:hypothetical protein [Micromonospora psammae]|uniref:hypothetical protein n=1 Tax=Micromonospora sp. CPCC 205556 TaxID=3122398 RepID=UPI002FF35242
MDLQSLIEAKTLFGWPIEAADEMVALKQLTNTDAIKLSDWRERDREIRASLPPLPEDAKKALDQAVDEIVGGDRYDDEAAKLLLRRLTAINHPAPDNAGLRKDLVELAELLKTYPKHHLAIQQRRQRIIRWLREEDDRDPVTMLPWSFIARFRTVDDPELGPVPQPVMAARKRALEQATAEQIADAQAMGGQRVDSLPVSADLTLYALTRFPKLLIEADTDDPEAAELPQPIRDLWNNPATQRALRRETANGWPPEYE